MGKIILIVFCALCFVGMICAEIFVSMGEKKPSDRKKHSGQDEDDSKE
ncbi:MAG: hypothetical protein IJ060_07660 [Oscillospiraceae bacterium]|nr:hypothetical protein [Oscillospiraceae bacterium]